MYIIDIKVDAYIYLTFHFEHLGGGASGGDTKSVPSFRPFDVPVLFQFAGVASRRFLQINLSTVILSPGAPGRRTCFCLSAGRTNGFFIPARRGHLPGGGLATILLF